MVISDPFGPPTVDDDDNDADDSISDVAGTTLADRTTGAGAGACSCADGLRACSSNCWSLSMEPCRPEVKSIESLGRWTLSGEISICAGDWAGDA